MASLDLGPLYQAALTHDQTLEEQRALLPQSPPHEGWEPATYPTAQYYLGYWLLFGEGASAEFRKLWDDYNRDVARIVRLDQLYADHSRHSPKSPRRHVSELRTELRRRYTFVHPSAAERVPEGVDPRDAIESYFEGKRVARIRKRLDPRGPYGYFDLDHIDHQLVDMGLAAYDLDPRGWMASMALGEEERRLRGKHVLRHPSGRWLTDEELRTELESCATPKEKVKGVRYAKTDAGKRQTELRKIPSRMVRFRECEEMFDLAVDIIGVLREEGCDDLAEQIADDLTRERGHVGPLLQIIQQAMD